VIAIRKAIGKEDEAYRLYRELSGDAKGRNLQALFSTLSVEELKHEALLKECLKHGAIKAALERVTERYDDLSLLDRVEPVSESAEIRLSLEFAMKLEAQANRDYTELGQTATDPELKGVFSFLSQQEREHFTALKRASEMLGTLT
jgi:rubrerythrin